MNSSYAFWNSTRPFKTYFKSTAFQESESICATCPLPQFCLLEKDPWAPTSLTPRTAPPSALMVHLLWLCSRLQMPFWSVWLDHSKMTLSAPGPGHYPSTELAWGCFIVVFIVFVVAVVLLTLFTRLATPGTDMESTVTKTWAFSHLLNKNPIEDLCIWLTVYGGYGIKPGINFSPLNAHVFHKDLRVPGIRNFTFQSKNGFGY